MLLPMQLDRATATGIEFDFQALARLKPGVTLAQAQAEITRMIPLLPQPFEKLKLQQGVRPLAADVIGNIADVLWILFAAVSVVLLIACGNVANLFLIRAEGRQMELAMRTALGASRGRLARVLLSESMLLSFAGGVLGVMLAVVIISLLRRMAPAQLPRLDDIDIGPLVLMFTLAISMASGVVFGLMTVIKFGRPNPAALKEGGRSGDAPSRHRTRNVLVVAQIALALMLMVVSGLMIRTFAALRDVPPGFARAEQVQTFRIAIPPQVTADPRQAARTYESIAERVRQVPGVMSVGISSSVTMDGEDNGNPIDLEEFPRAQGELPKLRRFKSIGPGYFETMGNPMAAGRPITWEDIHQNRPVIVVSKALAREYWGEPARAIGKRVRGGGGGGSPWREIVGVSGDERDDGLNLAATAIVYWPMVSESYQRSSFAFVVRSTRVGTPAFMREIQQAVWSIDRNLPLATVQTLDEILAQWLAQTSFVMVMLAIAAGVALLLGMVGIYGVIAYMAAQRTREIGIRMAIGAQLSDVRALFLRHGLWLTVIGITVGVALSLVLTRVMSALLFGVKASDPMTYIAVSGTLAAVALFATHLPARRAARVDPIVALRADA